MKLDQNLLDAAIDLMNRRFPNEGGLAAAAYTAEGNLYTSVVFDPSGVAVVYVRKQAH
jgi:cytidine deaminase